MLRLAQLEVQLQALQSHALSASSMKIQRPKAPPMSLFTGLIGNGGFEIDQWLREVQKQFTHFGDKTFPDDRSKIQLAVQWLSGAAQDWWENEDKSGVVDWNSFVERLRHRYRPQMPAELARQRIRTLVQRGRCETYCNEYLKLVSRIPDRSEEDKIFDFKNGLDRPLAAKVAEKQPKTLQEAMEIAVQAEPYVTNRGGVSSSAFRSTPSAFIRSSASSSSGAVPMELNAASIDPSSVAEESSNDDSVPSTTSSHDESSSSSDPLRLLLAKIETMESRLHSMQHSSNKGKAGNNKSRNYVPGSLTAADIEKLKKEGRCFRCKQQGHMKNDCPQLRLKY